MAKMTREEFRKVVEERMKKRREQFEKEIPRFIGTGEPIPEEYLLKKEQEIRAREILFSHMYFNNRFEGLKKIDEEYKQEYGESNEQIQKWINGMLEEKELFLRSEDALYYEAICDDQPLSSENAENLRTFDEALDLIYKDYRESIQRTENEDKLDAKQYEIEKTLLNGDVYACGIDPRKDQSSAGDYIMTIPAKKECFVIEDMSKAIFLTKSASGHLVSVPGDKLESYAKAQEEIKKKLNKSTTHKLD